MYRFSQSLLSITNFRTTACNSLICCQTGLKVTSWTRISSTATLQNKLHASCTFLLLVLQYLSVSRLCHRYALTEKAWEDAIQRLGNSLLLVRQLGPIVTGTFREKVAMLITGKRGMDHVKTPNFVSSCSVRHVNHLLAFLIRCSFWSSYISSLLLNFYEVLNSWVCKVSIQLSHEYEQVRSYNAHILSARIENVKIIQAIGPTLKGLLSV